MAEFFHQLFPKIWYERHWSMLLLFPLLLPLSWLYCLVTRGRRLFYDLFPGNTPLPVVVVGNITVGGTGKTPFVIYLTSRLRDWGWNPGVITRGYGGRVPGPVLVEDRHDAETVGDETVLLRRHLSCPIVKAHDRNIGIEMLRNQGCDVVVSDDGLQHFNMRRQLEIVLLDSERDVGNGLCLPAGPLRESKRRLDQVDLVLRNGTSGDQGFVYQYTGFKQVAGVDQLDLPQAKRYFSGQSVHAMAGIGHPGRFFQALSELGIKRQCHEFPDHHRYSQSDLDALPGTVIMTEKDAMKCKQLRHPDMWYLGVEVQSNAALDERLLQLTKNIGCNRAS